MIIFLDQYFIVFHDIIEENLALTKIPPEIICDIFSIS